MTTQSNKLLIPERAIEHIVHTNNGVQQIKLLHHTIGYVLQGDIRIYDKGCSLIQKGEIYILRAGWHTIEYFSDGTQLCEEIVVRISNNAVSTILCNLELNAHTPQPHHHTPTATYAHQSATSILKIYYKGLRKYLAMQTLNHSVAMETMKIHELIYLIYHQLPLIAICIQQIATHHKNRFQDHIRSNIFKNLTIPELAKICGMCTSTFKNTFKRHYGCSPHLWFITQRMNAVCIALRHTDEPIKNISHTYGFASSSHMIRLFKAHYGVTPAQYRFQNSQAPSQLPQPSQAEVLPQASIRQSHRVVVK